MRKDLYQELYFLEAKHWWHVSKRRVVSNYINRFLKKKRVNILDIGCGTGMNLEQLKKYGAIYGLDNSEEAIKFCRKRGLQNIKLGIAEKMPYKSNFFDLITMLDVLEHTNDNKTLKEAYRILKKDGLLIITVPAFSWLWSEWDKILHHRKRYSKKSIAELLKDSNLAVIYSTYLYSFLVFPAFIIRKIKQIFSSRYSSDFKLSNDLINKVMIFISKVELMFTQKIPLPLGTSIFVIAKK